MAYTENLRVVFLYSRSALSVPNHILYLWFSQQPPSVFTLANSHTRVGTVNQVVQYQQWLVTAPALACVCCGWTPGKWHCPSVPQLRPLPTSVTNQIKLCDCCLGSLSCVFNLAWCQTGSAYQNICHAMWCKLSMASPGLLGSETGCWGIGGCPLSLSWDGFTKQKRGLWIETWRFVQTSRRFLLNLEDTVQYFQKNYKNL